MKIKEGKRYTVNACDTVLEVRVLSVDDDESCNVWVVMCDDCDTDMMLPRSAFIKEI